MEIKHYFNAELTDRSGVAEVRRKAVDLAERLGFPTSDISNVAIVATEAATNLIKHAKQAELIIQWRNAVGVPEIEIIAIDKGPGINDLAGSLGDGYSTTGTFGTGLGAIRRLSSKFDIHTDGTKGTALLARMRPAKAEIKPPPIMEIGAVVIPKRGETACGDDWASSVNHSKIRIVVADGLGHGVLAAEASQKATQAFLEKTDLAPVDQIKHIHNSVVDTRGAVGAVAEIDIEQQQVRYSGIGNISGVIFTPEKLKSMVSHGGILGRQFARSREYVYPWSQESILVLHTDGLTNKWKMDDYPGLRSKQTSLIAAVLYRDANRGNDDCAVVVVKQ